MICYADLSDFFAVSAANCPTLDLSNATSGPEREGGGLWERLLPPLDGQTEYRETGHSEFLPSRVPR
jgi:hypothetical protein